MSQLLVRSIEPAVVKKLRGRAAAQGVSVEEAHRRLLRAALTGGAPAKKGDFIEYLLAIPKGAKGAAVEFPRLASLPRDISF